jgi:hypothetical protein
LRWGYPQQSILFHLLISTQIRKVLIESVFLWRIFFNYFHVLGIFVYILNWIFFLFITLTIAIPTRNIDLNFSVHLIINLLIIIVCSINIAFPFNHFYKIIRQIVFIFNFLLFIFKNAMVSFIFLQHFNKHLFFLFNLLSLYILLKHHIKIV